MPSSPFVRLTQENTSDESMTSDRPNPADPILEHWEGSNHPYRGIEQHGVKDTGDPKDVTPEWSGGTRPVVYDEPVSEPDPIPVRIVTEASRELRRARFFQYAISVNSVARVVSKNPDRTKVRVKNLSAFTVFIDEGVSVATYTGYPLAQNESIELDTQDELYILNPDIANVATIAVADQFAVSIN